MEKIDILLIAVFIFGAASFFAVSYCIKLHRAVYNIYNILNKHKDIMNEFIKISEGFNSTNGTQCEFNNAVINNIDKLDKCISIINKDLDSIKAKVKLGTSSTGGRRSEAEA